MSVAFSRTMRSLNTDSPVRSLLFACFLAAVLGLWIAWLLLARVSVYAVSDSARLEAATATHPVQSLYAGRVVSNHLVLGRKVNAGDILVELDTSIQRLQLEEERTQSEVLYAQLDTLQKEIAAETEALKEQERAAAIGTQEALARLREAEATASYASLDADRKGKLHEAGLIAPIELARATSEAEKHRAVVESLRLSANRQKSEQLALTSERRSRIEALRREVNRLIGLKTTIGAAATRLESELELRRITAPINGTIGEVATLRPGAVVSAGERLGAVIPSGNLKVVAQFAPAKALGRVQNGQQARLRFEGFPWTQYGSLSATVASVANEVRDGYVRVELRPQRRFQIPLQHGLPGSTEIEVERISPAALLLRTAGQMLASQQRKPAAPQDQAENGGQAK